MCGFYALSGIANDIINTLFHEHIRKFIGQVNEQGVLAVKDGGVDPAVRKPSKKCAGRGANRLHGPPTRFNSCRCSEPGTIGENLAQRPGFAHPPECAKAVAGMTQNHDGTGAEELCARSKVRD